MAHSVAEASSLAPETQRCLAKDGIVHLEELATRRVGELWARYGSGPKWKDWFSLLRTMRDAGLSFQDCAPAEVLKADIRDYRFEAPVRQARMIDPEGPSCLGLYNYLTVDDLAAGLPHFDEADRAVLKVFLTMHLPGAPVLKDL